jgi:gliding motility-associated-like protein
VGDVLTLTAVEIPSWLTFTPQGNGKALLSGSPPANAVGAVSVKLQARDPGNATAQQDYTLYINTRPVNSDFAISLNEDETKIIGANNFQNAYSDADNDPLDKIQIVKLPEHGRLLLNSTEVIQDQEITVSALNSLAYRPLLDYSGDDYFEWKAADEISYALLPARVSLTIAPLNDPPVITSLETAILEFSVGEGPGPISTIFAADDVDNENLTRAEIGFRRQNFVPEVDMLYFTDTDKIKGDYDEISGVLILTGTATIEEYNAAIRSITYDNISEVFTSEEVIKTLYYTVSDGLTFSETHDRQIKLIDLFEDLIIPNGFTPNDDEANNTWSITNLERYTDAVIKVYTMRGEEVYSSVGTYEEWDGTYNGDALPSDTYYYTIDLRLPFRKKIYKGAVTILR